MIQKIGDFKQAGYSRGIFSKQCIRLWGGPIRPKKLIPHVLHETKLFVLSIPHHSSPCLGPALYPLLPTTCVPHQHVGELQVATGVPSGHPPLPPPPLPPASLAARW